ncbi:hypothetical protein ACFX5Q_07320 [Mesorhizobium sp. IMUNJ 23033]|uniref:hypothetical protein n=1 Tax=Mesorhizobium sp. IMUNJ 23033 TaxID=3378039 RepID=UPI00384B8112
MSALIAFILGNKAFLGFLAAVLGALGFGLQQRLAGAKAERNKQAAKDLAAVNDRLEMDREATATERQATGMTDEQAKKEAAPWVRH